MPSPFWSGWIRFADVTIPVTASAAVDARATRISSRQLHDECYERVRITKGCPIHGELRAAEIVQGFEPFPGQVVPVSRSELDSIQTAAEHTIVLNHFLSRREIAPIRYAGKGYYLVPNGPESNSLYRVLHQAMVEEDVFGFAQVPIRRREQLVVISPVDHLLTMTVLHYAATIRPAAMFRPRQDWSSVSEQQLTQARDWIRATKTDDSALAAR